MEQHHQLENQEQDDGSYYQEHADFEDNGELSLDMLKDSEPGVKPLYPFSTLIRCAIKGSPGGKLLLEDIYFALEKRFEYFRTSAPGWKNTIRHTLSLHPSFEKVPRPLTDRGKGCYWTINEVVDPRAGVQRARKKKEPKRNTRARHGGNSDSVDSTTTFDFPPEAAAQFAYAASSSRVVQPTYGFTQFDSQGNAYPVPVPASMRYAVEEDAYEPEIDPTGQPDWHAIWKNELRRLRHATIEQMRAGAGPEWYKMMADTVRGAFALPEAHASVDPQEGQLNQHHQDQAIEGTGTEDGIPLAAMPAGSNQASLQHAQLGHVAEGLM